MNEILAKKSAEFEIKTGIKPTRVYLGYEEITSLLQFVFENQYICKEPSEAEITGDHRPEVAGLLVYAVNDKNHFEIG